MVVLLKQCKLFFILGLIPTLFCTTLFAWNDDYAPEKQITSRTVCVKTADSNSTLILSVHSIPIDEACPKEEIRHQLIVGKNPLGSLALFPLMPKQSFFPPLKLEWQARGGTSNHKLWHFTCLKLIPDEIFGTPYEKRRYLGEITSSAEKQSCESASIGARTYCEQQLGGSELLEQCFEKMGEDFP